MNTDSYQAMLAAVRAFHDKHRFKATGGEDLVYRIALMAEECADLMILVLGTAIAADFDLKEAFWGKLNQLDRRTGRFVKGRLRVSDFD